jgi:hypothetical protein
MVGVSEYIYRSYLKHCGDNDLGFCPPLEALELVFLFVRNLQEIEKPPPPFYKRLFVYIDGARS